MDLSFVDSRSDVFTELTRSYFPENSADWLLVDFSDADKELLKHENTYIAAINGLCDSMAYRAFMTDDKSFAPYLDDFDKEYIEKAVKGFAKTVTERYGSKIILRKTHLSLNRLDMTGRIRPFEDTQYIIEKNKLTAYCEELFIKLTDCFVIDYENSYMPVCADKNADVSERMLESDFYKEASKAVDKILSGDSEKTLCNVDIVGYIERCERIKADNPDMSAELSREIFGGAARLFMTE